MGINEILILIVIGLLAGILSGSLGIGGGIVVIPAMIYIMKYSQQEAQGISLIFLLPPLGVLAVYNYYKNGFIDASSFKVAGVLMVAFFVGTYFGSSWMKNISGATLKKIFAILMFVASLKMFFGK